VKRPPRTLFDTGAQLERTTLAWVRTALGFAAAGAVVARFAETTSRPLLLHAAGAALVATGVAVGGLATRSYPRRHAVLHAGAPPAPPLPLRYVSAGIAFATASALLTALS
jgi:putative membrane protein